MKIRQSIGVAARRRSLDRRPAFAGGGRQQRTPAADGRHPRCCRSNRSCCRTCRHADRRDQGGQHPARSAGRSRPQGVCRSEAGHRQPDQRRARDPRKARRQQRPRRIADPGSRFAAPVDAAGRASGGRHRTRRRAGDRRQRRRRQRPPAGAGAVGVSPQKLFDCGDGRLLRRPVRSRHPRLRSATSGASPRPIRPTMRSCTSARPICSDGKNDKAVDAFDKAIRNYPTGNKIARRVLSEGCRAANLDRRRRRARGVGTRRSRIIRTAMPARLAKQRLEQLAADTP